MSTAHTASQLTSCVGWHPDSWLLWPTVNMILSACIQSDFWAKCFVLTIHAPCKANANWANLYTVQGDLRGIICLFSADCVVNFAKKLQKRKKSHSDPVTSLNAVKKIHSALCPVWVLPCIDTYCTYAEVVFVCRINDYILVGLQLMFIFVIDKSSDYCLDQWFGPQNLRK